ncbi:MAG: ATP-binding cassette domain-containing protein [Acidobacteriota bacterium]
MLIGKGMTAGYGGPPVVHEVSMKVGSGEIVALIGRNASGKSTVLRALMGLVELDRGAVELSGEALDGRATRERLEAGLGYMPQGGRLFPDLTIEENVQVYLGRRYSYDVMFDQMLHWEVPEKIKRGNVFGAILRLLGRHKERARNLSGGEKQLISITRTLLRPSDFILLDEPSIGLSRALLAEVGEILRSFAERGTGIVVVDQNVSWILEMSDKTYIMHQGRIAAEGPSRRFQEKREELYEAFGLKTANDAAGGAT